MSMEQRTAQMTLLLKKEEEVTAFYVHQLQFNLLKDAVLNQIKRWMRVAPKGSAETSLLLTKSGNEQEFSQCHPIESAKK